MNLSLGDQSYHNDRMRDQQVSPLQRQCSLTFNGEKWDVSNLSLPERTVRRSSLDSRRSMVQSDDTSRSLYPSLSAINDLLDNPTDAARGTNSPPIITKTSSEKEIFPNKIADRRTQRRHSALGHSSHGADFRDEYSRIARKPQIKKTFNDDWDKKRSAKDSSSADSDSGNYSDNAKRGPAHDQFATVQFPRMEVEVGPDCYMPMVGAAETSLAVRQGRVRPTTCMGCDAQLHCMMTVTCVICPTCKVVSPVTFQHADGLKVEGVGLGLTAEHLQTEMAAGNPYHRG